MCQDLDYFNKLLEIEVTKCVECKEDLCNENGALQLTFSPVLITNLLFLLYLHFK